MLKLPNPFLILSLLVLSTAAVAQSPTPAAVSPAPAATPAPDAFAAPDTVLISNGLTTLTRADYDLEITRLPADARGGFSTDPARINGLLNRMLVTKTTAAEARRAGIDKLPETQQRIEWEVERVLSALYIERIEADAAREFDARPGIEAAAHERWIVDKDKYRVPESAAVTQILFSLTKHSKEEALKLAQDTRARIVAGADMNELAVELSDDPLAPRTGGRIENIVREKMDPAFAGAVFSLEKPGDLSEPVLSRFGYHLIRLDSKRASTLPSFAEVKPQILAEMRRQYVDQRRTERLAAIRNDPKIVVNEPAVNALVTPVDQQAIRKAVREFSGSASGDAAAAGTPPK